MSSRDAVITISKLSKHYQKKPVLQDLNLVIHPGQSIALAGKNGAGKTTLIEIIMGLRFPSSGRVDILGRSALEDDPWIREQIGFLSETVPFYEEMSVAQQLAFHSQFYSNWDSELAEKLTEQLQVKPSATIENLSRGEKLRLGLVTAMSHRPPLLVLDEVTAGMDPLVREQLGVLLKETVSNSGTSILFATNLLYNAPEFCSHIAFLDHGRISEPEALENIDGNLETYFVERLN